MRIIILLSLFLSSTSMFAGDGYKINFEVKNYDASELIIGFYYGEQTLVKDTLRTDKADGKFVLEGEEPLEHGIYLLLTQPESEFIQFIVNEDQEFTLITDKEDLGDVKFKGSEENSKFYNYLDFIKERRVEAEELQAQKSHLDSLDQSTDDITTKIQKVNESVKTKQAEVVSQNPNSIIAILINANKQLDVPEFEGTLEEKRAQKFNYYKSHFFDNIPLGRPEILRTPFLHDKVDYFLERLTHAHPDSIIRSLDIILEKTKPAEDTYRYYLSKFLNKYHGSKVVGYDAVYVHLALKYYANGEAPWVDEENLNKILDKARRTKPLLIGNPAPDFTAKDKQGNAYTFSKIDADYKVLMFWKPDCGHCKKAMPFVIDFQEKFKDKGIKVISFCTDGRKNIEKCWEGVEEKNMGTLINLADEEGRSRAQAKFYATSTPYIYIVDREGEILMKRIGAEQLETVMDEIIKMKESENNQGED